MFRQPGTLTISPSSHHRLPLCRPIGSGLLLVALLISYAVNTGAQDVAGSPPIWFGPEGEPLPFRSHEDALEFLSAAKVLETEEIEGTQNRPLKVLLEKDGVRAHAIFRNVYETWQRSWIRGKWYIQLLDRATSERAAYVVARMLAFDNIPPTVLRGFDGQRGTFQLWLEKAESHSDQLARRAAPPEGWVDQMSAIWVFDNLLFNADRHPGNLLIDTNGRVWMIDHTQTFQYDDRLIDADEVRSIPRFMWERLQTIPDSEFEKALEGVINDHQLSAFLERRVRLIEHIERLIVERGEDRVVRSDGGS